MDGGWNQMDGGWNEVDGGWSQVDGGWNQVDGGWNQVKISCQIANIGFNKSFLSQKTYKSQFRQFIPVP